MHLLIKFVEQNRFVSFTEGLGFSSAVSVFICVTTRAIQMSAQKLLLLIPNHGEPVIKALLHQMVTTVKLWWTSVTAQLLVPLNCQLISTLENVNATKQVSLTFRKLGISLYYHLLHFTLL